MVCNVVVCVLFDVSWCDFLVCHDVCMVYLLLLNAVCFLSLGVVCFVSGRSGCVG